MVTSKSGLTAIARFKQNAEPPPAAVSDCWICNFPEFLIPCLLHQRPTEWVGTTIAKHLIKLITWTIALLHLGETNELCHEEKVLSHQNPLLKTHDQGSPNAFHPWTSSKHYLSGLHERRLCRPPKRDGVMQWWFLNGVNVVYLEWNKYFNNFALRTLWTEWKSKKVGHWKGNSPVMLDTENVIGDHWEILHIKNGEMELAVKQFQSQMWLICQ